MANISLSLGFHIMKFENLRRVKGSHGTGLKYFLTDENMFFFISYGEFQLGRFKAYLEGVVGIE